MRNRILEELYNNKGSYISGEDLRIKLNVSRTAIWKHINTLREEGYNIETAHRKGYRLLEMEDKLFPEEIKVRLFNNNIGKEVLYFESINSTNSYGKEKADSLKSGTVILSEEQLEGRGRRGKEWQSSKGTGIWMSLVLKPDLQPTEGVKMTQIAAASVCKAIREVTGLNALIKWPNDIVVNGKKVCGILTEMAGELNEISYIVIGIGINVNTVKFSDDLKEKATSLYIEGNKKVDRKEIVIKILEEFEKLYNLFIKELNLEHTLEIVKKYSAVLGKEIRIIQGKKEKIVKAIEIDNEGMLVIENENCNIELISSGEVSIRGENGYI